MLVKIKDIQYFLVIQTLFADKDILNMDILSEKKNMTDLEALKSKYEIFANIKIREESKIDRNSVNNKDIYDYIKAKKISYVKNRLFPIPECQISVKLPPRFIYLEDLCNIESLDYLEFIAKKYDIKFITQKSFPRGSKAMKIYKMDLDIVERINILKKSIAYIGYDYSPLANFAQKLLPFNNVHILDSNLLSEMELLARFAPTNNLDFIRETLDIKSL